MSPMLPQGTFVCVSKSHIDSWLKLPIAILDVIWEVHNDIRVQLLGNIEPLFTVFVLNPRLSICRVGSEIEKCMQVIRIMSSCDFALDRVYRAYLPVVITIIFTPDVGNKTERHTTLSLWPIWKGGDTIFYNNHVDISELKRVLVCIGNISLKCIHKINSQQYQLT